MPLKNGLPLAVFPGNPWSGTAPQQMTEAITTYDIEEADALNTPPDADLAWSEVGSKTSVGVGIVKVLHRMPQTLDFAKFKVGGRDYNHWDVVATTVKANPFSLAFETPMVEMGNGWKLMSTGSDRSLIDFIGVGGIAADYVLAGRAWKCQMMASLLYSGLYATTGGLNTVGALLPTAFTYPQPNNPNGIALFTDGTGAEGTPGAQHYANPTVPTSARFKNVWFGFGSIDANFGASLVKMTIKPNATLSNRTSGARVTDVFGGTAMRDKFWRLMVQGLTLQTATVGGQAVGAATTNPYSEAVSRGLSEDNFVGSAFGPRRYWIVPEMDNHPYLVANPTADFWINVSAGPRRPAWARLASNSAQWVPTFRQYGPGDPQAQRDRMYRWEGDLDGGASPGAPGEVDMFGSV